MIAALFVKRPAQDRREDEACVLEISYLADDRSPTTEGAASIEVRLMRSSDGRVVDRSETKTAK